MTRKGIAGLVGAFLLGSFGPEILGSKPMQKFYTGVCTGALLMRNRLMEKAEHVQAGASDIAANAKANVENYYAERDAAFDQGIDADEVKEG